MYPGDLLLAVGPKDDLKRFQMTVGEEMSGGFDAGFRQVDVPTGPGGPALESWVNLG